MSSDNWDPILAEKIHAAIKRVSPRSAGVVLRPEMSLVDDLGLDSIRFIDLAFALEQALGLVEFPMQDWSDSEATCTPRYTVGSLLMVCQDCLAQLAKETHAGDGITGPSA